MMIQETWADVVVVVMLMLVRLPVYESRCLTNQPDDSDFRLFNPSATHSEQSELISDSNQASSIS